MWLTIIKFFFLIEHKYLHLTKHFSVSVWPYYIRWLSIRFKVCLQSFSDKTVLGLEKTGIHFSVQTLTPHIYQRVFNL